VTDGENEIITFSNLGFIDMMLGFADLLHTQPEAEAWMLRTERPGLSPLELDPATTQLLREDPMKAIQPMIPPPVRVFVRDEVRPESTIKVRVRGGYDTLADAFGDEMYLRHKDGKTECFGCGRWHPTDKSVVCYGEVNEMIEGAVVGNWFVVNTARLISLCCERYFLPRAWNESGPWISHEDLQKKYDEYLKEKEACSRPPDDK